MKNYYIVGLGISLSFSIQDQASSCVELLKDNELSDKKGLVVKKQPNILYVFCDQLRADALSCYGDPNVKTPNIDKLAEEGVLFNQAISTYPVCSPYRAQMLTGKYPFHNGVIGNNRIPFVGQETFGSLIKKAGYRTGYIGKWDIWPRSDVFIPKEARPGFEDYFMCYNCSHANHLNGYYFDTDGNKICFPCNRHTSAYEPTVQIDLALDFINVNANKDEPFCLFVSWGPPHDPRDLIPEEKKVTVAENLILRENINDRTMIDEMLSFDSGYQYSPFREVISIKTTQKRIRDRKNLDSEQYIRNDMALYYDNIMALDDEFGRLLESLKENGIIENTIIVFTSDHGDMLGSHRMGSKQMPYEESIRVPFIVRYPQKIKSGQTTNALISPVDIMPSLFSLAGIEIPKGDGKDVSEAMLGGKFQKEGLLIGSILSGGNPLSCNNIRPWRGVRTNRYTFAKFLEPEEKDWLLFDNLKDPYQLNNLIHDENYKLIKNELSTMTDKLRQECGEEIIQAQSRTQINTIINNKFQNNEKRRFFIDGKWPVFINKEKANMMECQ